MRDSSAAIPRIAFGMIVLNGEPFLRYNLRAIYPFAHEIIVVEGAVETAASIATDEGHSRDATLETLLRFKEQEDPQNKLTIVTRDGFWSEKDEQSQAFAARATGDYLWQVDVDEFYQPHDMQAVIDELAESPDITAVSFKQLAFWGGFDYLTDGWYLHEAARNVNRIFRWQLGASYIAHRPPTVKNAQGQDLRDLHWIRGDEMARRGIWLYHYSLLFPKQVQEKSRYYDAANWVRRTAMTEWTEETYLALKRPYRVHNVYEYMSWLERFDGQHPPQINALRADIEAGRVAVDLRQTADIERLLRSPLYRAGRLGLKTLSPLRRFGLHVGRAAKRRLWTR